MSNEIGEGRSPVHVVYGGAHLFKPDTPKKLGGIALKTLETYATNFVEFALAMGLAGSERLPSYPQAMVDLEKKLDKSAAKVKESDPAAWFAWTVYQRTIKKLKNEPVEDFRIDFEDGYGFRSDEEEDGHAVAASTALAKTFADGTITKFCGFRIKSLAPETSVRGIRTLELFLDNFLLKTVGKIPDNFVVTLPKVTDRKEIKKLVDRLSTIEKKAKIKSATIGIEIMVETPRAIFDEKGRLALPAFIKAAKGRCRSAHFGAYDYTALLGISAIHQRIDHPACDFARQVMQVSLAPLSIRLSDSVTTEIPVPVHSDGSLTKIQREENRRAIHHAWRTHYNNVTRSMTNGFYQSWDLHPNQLVGRYAAVFAFFLESLDARAARLRGFIEKATQASMTGNTFDDAASAQGLLNFFRMGIDCGAIAQQEAKDSTGLTADDISSPFQEIFKR
jgi:citrate lyase beta subunit